MHILKTEAQSLNVPTTDAFEPFFLTKAWQKNGSFLIYVLDVSYVHVYTCKIIKQHMRYISDKIVSKIKYLCWWKL